MNPILTPSLTVAAPGVLGNDDDSDADSMAATLVSGPSHASSFSLNSDGSFSYTPASGFHGVDRFTYSASDGFASSNATVVIGVADNAPVATNGVLWGDANASGWSVWTDEVSAADVVFRNYVSDADGDSIQAVEVVSGPAHGSVSISGTTFSYTPGSSPYPYTGTDSFTYRVFDGVLWSNAATIDILVIPHAYPDEYTVTHNTTLSPETSLFVNDVGYSLHYSSTESTRPLHGTLTVDDEGYFTYVPTAGYVGDDFFLYSIYDDSSGAQFFHASYVLIHVT